MIYQIISSLHYHHSESFQVQIIKQFTDKTELPILCKAFLKEKIKHTPPIQLLHKYSCSQKALEVVIRYTYSAIPEVFTFQA